MKSMLDFINANIDDNKVLQKIESIFSVWSASCPPLLVVLKKNGENPFIRKTVNGLTKSMALEIVVGVGLDVNRPFEPMNSILQPYKDEILSLKASLASTQAELSQREKIVLDVMNSEARLTNLLDSYGPSCGVNHLIQRVVSKFLGVHLIDNQLWEHLFQGRSDESR